jgi:NAD/NADP transhydrogenase alpha subunit
VKKWLNLLGELDGAIMSAAAAYSVYDPSHVKAALLVAGGAGALGVVLNAVAKFLGLPDVAPSKAAS